MESCGVVGGCVYTFFDIGVDRPAIVLVAISKGKGTPSGYSADYRVAENAIVRSRT